MRTGKRRTAMAEEKTLTAITCPEGGLCSRRCTVGACQLKTNGQNVEVLRMEIAKLDVAKDDTLVVRMPVKISREGYDQINDVMKRACPGVKILIVDPGTEFLILRPSKTMDLLRPEGAS
jgi:hypothetical protein